MSQQKRTALLADDLVSSRSLIKRFLEAINYDVVEVDSEEELFQVTTELLPDVIILHERTSFDSWKAYQRLKASDPDHVIPLIFLTTNPKILQEKEVLPEIHVLKSPIDLDELKALLRL